MGEIYLATQAGPHGFQKLVALKRLKKEGLPKDAAQLFLNEARLTASLTHRNIIQVFDLGEDEDGLFVAMEYVHGPTLAALLNAIRPARMPVAAALEVTAQIAEALDYAHAAKGIDGSPLRVIHRDVSPSNILLGVSGDVKLIDFGVARSAQQAKRTLQGQIKGKISFMSPEQIQGLELDGRSDLFSLGIVLSQMLTGTHPFRRSMDVETFKAIISEDPESPSATDAALVPLDDLVARLLRKKREARLPTGRAVVDAIDRLQRDLHHDRRQLSELVMRHFGVELDATLKGLDVPGLGDFQKPQLETVFEETRAARMVARAGVEPPPTVIEPVPSTVTNAVAATSPGTPLPTPISPPARLSRVPSEPIPSPRLQVRGKDVRLWVALVVLPIVFIIAGEVRKRSESAAHSVPAQLPSAPMSSADSPFVPTTPHASLLAPPLAPRGDSPLELRVEGALATLNLPLTTDRGWVTLYQNDDRAVSLYFYRETKELNATLKCTPPAAVNADGKALGSTPVRLPQLGFSKPVRLHVEWPNEVVPLTLTVNEPRAKSR